MGLGSPRAKEPWIDDAPRCAPVNDPSMGDDGDAPTERQPDAGAVVGTEVVR